MDNIHVHDDCIKNKIKEITVYICKTENPYFWKNENDVSWDGSGKVYPMTIEDLNEICSQNMQFHTSKLEQILDCTYINQFVPSYISGYGKSWKTYKNLIEEELEEFLYDNWDFFDEEGYYLDDMEDFYYNALDLLQDFLEQTKEDIYIELIKNKVIDNQTI